jgi:two-component system NtrC family sensor kinase
MKLTRTIAFRLFLLIASIQTIILLALTYATVRVQQSNLMEQVVVSAHRVSEIIARSTRHSMLLNRQEEVQNIITSLRDQPGIEGIRIYNKLGAVIYGTVDQDLGTTVDVNAEACVSCHSGTLLEDPHPSGERFSRIFSKPEGPRVLGLITPIRNEAQCSNAACHAHPESKTILGVLDVKMSLAAVDQQLLASRDQLLFLSLASVLLVGMASGAFIWLFVRRPVKKLIIGMEMVSSGTLDHRLEVRTNDEIGQMARTFNDMSEDLAQARKEITAWSQTLEQKVREKTADLERAHKQMVHVEKMASLGQLASSVAHELNNPLEGILTFAKLLIKRVNKSSLPPAEMQPYCEDLKLIAEEAQRSGNIVKNLLVFSRQKGVSFHSVHLNAILERCNLLVNHHAKMNNVDLRISCTPDDVIECDPGQIQQLLIALMVNAIEAMSPVPGRPEGGILTVDARWSGKDDSLSIQVKDTGMGMSDEVKAHIFEPFFTTKSEGKGVGLGLAIAYGIVERHHGSIDVESTVGHGTLFTVTLPAKQPGDQASHGFVSPHEGAQA